MLLAIAWMFFRRSWRAPRQGYLEVRDLRIDRADNPAMFKIAVYLNYAVGLAFVAGAAGVVISAWLEE